MRRSDLLAVLILFGSMLAAAQGGVSPEQRTARHMEAIRREPTRLLLFLRQMPKGGDLHNHLSGAVYAESYIEYAAQDGLCVDRATSTLVPPPCDDAQQRPPVHSAFEDPALYNQLVDAFSILNFQPGAETLAQHFFHAFLKFDAATWNHRGDMLAEVVSRAAAEHITYLELISALDHMEASALGARLGWDADLPRMRLKLLDAGIPARVESARRRLDAAEGTMRERMRCGRPDADSGCQVVVRHIFEVHRAFPPEQVFAEMVFGFEMAAADPRVVSVNLVMAEAEYVSRRDFDLHMRMMDYLHGVYPGVRITLHAGELTPGLVPPEDLRDHIWKSIQAGHAQRIGHGVDVLHERDAEELLREMARRKILVEFTPSTHELLLSTPGVPHPLPLYLKFGVPVAVATDDIGVARSDTTAEYMRAVQHFGLTYGDLKKMVRHSLEYSFLTGDSLWADAATFRPVAACASDSPRAAKISQGCRSFLERSPRAKLQWDLEGQFDRFESRF